MNISNHVISILYSRNLADRFGGDESGVQGTSATGTFGTPNGGFGTFTHTQGFLYPNGQYYANPPQQSYPNAYPTYQPGEGK